jgi:hypothetical protein
MAEAVVLNQDKVLMYEADIMVVERLMATMQKSTYTT